MDFILRALNEMAKSYQQICKPALFQKNGLEDGKAIQAGLAKAQKEGPVSDEAALIYRLKLAKVPAHRRSQVEFLDIALDLLLKNEFTMNVTPADTQDHEKMKAAIFTGLVLLQMIEIIKTYLKTPFSPALIKALQKPQSTSAFNSIYFEYLADTIGLSDDNGLTEEEIISLVSQAQIFIEYQVYVDSSSVQGFKNTHNFAAHDAKNLSSTTAFYLELAPEVIAVAEIAGVKRNVAKRQASIVENKHKSEPAPSGFLSALWGRASTSGSLSSPAASSAASSSQQPLGQ